MMQISGEIFFFLRLKAIPAFFSLATVFTLQIATTSTKTYPVCMYRECNTAVPYFGYIRLVFGCFFHFFISESPI